MGAGGGAAGEGDGAVQWNDVEKANVKTRFFEREQKTIFLSKNYLFYAVILV